MIVFREPVWDNVMNAQRFFVFLLMANVCYAATSTFKAVSFSNELRECFPSQHFMSAANPSASPGIMVFSNLNFSHFAKSLRLSLSSLVIIFPLGLDSITAPPWLDVKLFQMTHDSAKVYIQNFTNLTIGLALKYIKAHQRSVKRFAYFLADFFCPGCVRTFSRAVHRRSFNVSRSALCGVTNGAMNVEVARHVILLVKSAGKIIRGQARYQLRAFQVN